MNRSVPIRFASAATMLLMAFLALPAAAVEPSVPPQVQAAIIAKLWQFDRNFVHREQLTLAVLYQSKFRISFVTAHDLCHEFEAAHLPVRCVLIDISDAVAPDQQVPQGVEAAYIAPLRAVNVEALFTALRLRRIRTVTAVNDYVLAGSAVGLALRGDHAEIVVNLPAARAEGADFSSQLLKLARIVE
ncbi:MAG TPA: YfiR family protein [Thermoanaerobaculia bacterium]|nr:YfiR family protein [Thermoanaerobaculia bacterium]